VPSADLLIPFFLAAAAFACVPGPGMLHAAARTLASGRRAGWRSAAGFHAAGLGHVAAAACGVSALLAVVPALFTAMTLVGAVYLIWLGIRALFVDGAPGVRPRARSAPTAPTARRDGFVVEILNPKSALFHLAFLPQFTDPSAGFPVWAQIVVLGVIVNAMFSATDAVLIEVSHGLARRLGTADRAVEALRRLGGGVLVGLGVSLALAWDR